METFAAAVGLLIGGGGAVAIFNGLKGVQNALGVENAEEVPKMPEVQRKHNTTHERGLDTRFKVYTRARSDINNLKIIIPGQSDDVALSDLELYYLVRLCLEKIFESTTL